MMWEPFTEPARRAIVRAQEVAQMFSSSFIGTEHIAFALAEGDNAVGQLLANAIDRDAIRARLGEVSREPVTEMVFSVGAKRSIETAFENARRLGHNYIGIAHLALGVLDSGDVPPLVAGHDVAQLREELSRAASSDRPRGAMWKLVSDPRPQRRFGRDARLAADAMVTALEQFSAVAKSGTRVTITFARGADEVSWTWTAAGDEP